MARWLDENFKRYLRGLHIVQAPQSCNKTGSLASLESERVLLVSPRNSLLAQIKDRLPNVISSLHFDISEDGTKRYLEDWELALRGQNKGLGINYSSLKKLTTTDLRFDYMIIDEPNLLLSHSTGYKPDPANENEYLYRLIHTPVVIFMGTDIPEHLKQEIDELGQLRGDRLIDPDEQLIEIEEDDYYRETYDPDLEQLREDLGI